MSNISILLRFNEKNQRSAEFARGFEEDLLKCLTRFQLSCSLNSNKSREQGDFGLLILSSDDDADDQFVNEAKQMISSGNNLIICADTINLRNLNLNDQKQPFLFWDKQFETGEIRLFRRDNVITKSNYWEKITDVVVEIASHYSSKKRNADKESIYISVDDISHNADRENLKRDLNDLGFGVMPDKPFSNNIEETSNQITEALGKSKLIIILIPPVYNIYFPDHHLSLTEHQCNVSAQFIRDQNSSAKRIIWISSAYEITDEENQVFIEKLQRDNDQLINTTVLKTSIEDLKKHYRQALSLQTNDGAKSESLEDVYVITDGNKENGLEKNLTDLFKQQNLGITSNYSGISYSQHLRKLARAKVAVVIYNNDNKEWLAVKANDILKSKGIDTALPFSRIILVKGNNEYEASSVEGIFTDILSDLTELSSIRISES